MEENNLEELKKEYEEFEKKIQYAYNEIGELIHSGGYYNGLRDKKTYFASYPSMSILTTTAPTSFLTSQSSLQKTTVSSSPTMLMKLLRRYLKMLSAPRISATEDLQETLSSRRSLRSR